MAEPRTIADLADVALLQALLARSAADTARIAADDEAKSASALASAENSVETAAAAWSTHHSSARFDPSMALILAADVLAKDRQVALRHKEHESSIADAARQKSAYERASAEERIGAVLLHGARRQARQRREESISHEVADRVTARWMKP